MHLCSYSWYDRLVHWVTEVVFVLEKCVSNSIPGNTICYTYVYVIVRQELLMAHCFDTTCIYIIATFSVWWSSSSSSHVQHLRGYLCACRHFAMPERMRSIDHNYWYRKMYLAHAHVLCAIIVWCRNNNNKKSDVHAKQSEAAVCQLGCMCVISKRCVCVWCATTITRAHVSHARPIWSAHARTDTSRCIEPMNAVGPPQVCVRVSSECPSIKLPSLTPPQRPIVSQTQCMAHRV